MNCVDDFIEVTFKEPGDFLKISETLSRIGIKSKGTKTLTQTCHILHKAGRYYIVHFKQMFALDGKPTTISESDYTRLRYIVTLLQSWGLLTVVSPGFTPNTTHDPITKVIPFSDKENWELVKKYNIGGHKK